MSKIALKMVEDMQGTLKHGQTFHPYSIQKAKKSEMLISIYKNLDFCKKQDNFRYVFLQKSGYFTLRDFS